MSDKADSGKPIDPGAWAVNALDTLTRWGFDPERMRFAIRTALASCLALLIGWLLGLEHPQWSAMTVWTASQPTRGMLVEKSLFRAAGTLVGVVFGIFLVWASNGEPAVLVLGLSLWVGLCAGAGNVLRSFTAYGAILAGYSAAMVALLEAAHPERIFALGLDRFLTVIVGVLVALLIGFLLTPRHAEDALLGRTRRVTARVLRAVAARLRGESRPSPAEQAAILAEIAGIEEALDPHGAGSLRSRRSARTLRALLVAQVQALVWIRSCEQVRGAAALGEPLDAAARALDSAAPPDEVLAALREAVRLSIGHRALHESIERTQAAIRTGARPEERAARRPHPVLLHRDWIGARHAMIRAIGTLLLLGAVWVFSGWSGGPFILLGTSVMISLFSTFDDPAETMVHIFLGQLFGAAAALICRWIAWPLAGSEAELVFLTMPFILLGILPVAHGRTMVGGFDYNLIMLLLLQPSFPLVGSFIDSLATALAVVAAPLVALAAFRFAFPADAARRRDTLVEMMVHELQALAARPDAPAHRAVWRARLYHRMLRLARWSEKAGERQVCAADQGLAVMQIGEAILLLHELRGKRPTPSLRRRLDTALRRLQRLGSMPEPAGRALTLLAERLRPACAEQAEVIGNAAAALHAHSDLLRSVSRPGAKASRPAPLARDRS